MRPDNRIQITSGILHGLPDLQQAPLKEYAPEKPTMIKTTATGQTTAMKRGVDLEPIAAKQYCEVTGNLVLPCGFVVNPHPPHLGTSPDRKVIERQGSTSYGLLEIKYPSKDRYKNCPYLIKHADGNYKLKESHTYFYQITGQLGLTGMPWCDFFVMCTKDYHLHLIHFDATKWDDMKNKLDLFFFDYFLSRCNQ